MKKNFKCSENIKNFWGNPQKLQNEVDWKIKKDLHRQIKKLCRIN